MRNNICISWLAVFVNIVFVRFTHRFCHLCQLYSISYTYIYIHMIDIYTIHIYVYINKNICKHTYIHIDIYPVFAACLGSLCFGLSWLTMITFVNMSFGECLYDFYRVYLWEWNHWAIAYVHAQLWWILPNSFLKSWCQFVSRPTESQLSHILARTLNSLHS